MQKCYLCAMNHSAPILLSSSPLGEMRLGFTPPQCKYLRHSDLAIVAHIQAPIVPTGTVGALSFYTLS